MNGVPIVAAGKYLRTLLVHHGKNLRKVDNAMAFQPVPDTVEITLVWLQNNENLTTTVHARKPGGYDLAAVTALAVAIDALVPLWLLPEMTAQATYVRVEVRGLAVINDVFAENNTSTAPGGNLGSSNPNSVTMSVKKSSGLSGKSARGRWYFVGIPVTSLSSIENLVDLIAANDIVDAVNAFRTGIVVAGWDPVILSRFTGGLLRPTGVTFDWLTTSIVNNFVDSQRRRLTR